MTQDHKIKAIIFDLGNVLVDFDHKIAARQISQFTSRNEQEIFELFFDSQLTGLFEEGKISPLEFFSKVKEMLNLKLDYKEFVPIWNGIFFLTEKNRLVYSFAKSLMRNYKLGLVSNINILHFDYLRKNFPIFDPFHKIITSYEVGFRKPHPFIYQNILRMLEILPIEAFYTDDRLELAKGAKELGIQAFVFKSAQQLKQDLLAAGINIK